MVFDRLSPNGVFPFILSLSKDRPARALPFVLSLSKEGASPTC